ncbi:MAG: endolytic transglycosylase MltG, partial [Oscillospiraceae bacterium]|nr:endolytic transglycosylase MltG [Oscillospiraceae bacterium]
MKKVISLIIAAVVLVAGVIGFSAMGDIKGSEKPGTTVTVEIPKGTGANAIGEILAENGVIKNSLYFKLYIKANPDAKLQYGQFTLDTNMSYDKIIETLSTIQDKRETVSVTFPEGFTLIQMAKRMENNGLCSAEEFIDVANNGDFSQFEFWNKIKEHEHKFMKGEGYLYPDTYEFFPDDTVYNMVAKLYATFDSKITQEMYDRMDEIGMTLDEVVTLSSFVQEEAGHPEEQPFVAACLRNRVSENSLFPLLQCNVCSNYEEDGNYVFDYIISYYGGRSNVPAGMVDAYNTYNIKGLPPGPISNPGIDAITATLWPDEEMLNDGYYFFVTDLT